MQSTRESLHVLAARLLKDVTPEEAVVLAWPLVCGSAVAQRTEALSFENLTLRVRVPDRSWKSQLEAFSARYVEKLSRLTGASITRIAYEIQSEPAISSRHRH